MKIICISCGHGLALDECYNDFEGLIKCYVCGALLEIKTSEGKLQALNVRTLSREARPPTEHAGNLPV